MPTKNQEEKENKPFESKRKQEEPEYYEYLERSKKEVERAHGVKESNFKNGGLIKGKPKLAQRGWK